MLRYRALRPPLDLSVRTQATFGDNAADILREYAQHAVLTSRSPGLLNHFMRFPRPAFTGLTLLDRTTNVGFGVCSVLRRGRGVEARIVDCLLPSTDAGLWQSAIHAMVRHIRERTDAGIVTCMATAPWFTEALSANGFYIQSNTPFYLRDPQGVVIRDRPFHLSYLEADGAYL
jgi:hypothetical protein